MSNKKIDDTNLVIKSSGNVIFLTFLQYLLDWGQVLEAESISAGLDYPGISPLHCFLKDAKRAKYTSATDEDALMFCPGSQISDKPLKDISHLMFEPQKFALIKLDKIRGNACVSRSGEDYLDNPELMFLTKVNGKITLQNGMNVTIKYVEGDTKTGITMPVGHDLFTNTNP